MINDVLKSYVNPRDVLDFNSATNVDEVEEATGEPTEGEGENKQLVMDKIILLGACNRRNRFTCSRWLSQI
ncbi:hypothetical protein [Vallitalea guaymasensis]|uniref:hypothetical protein n=1 Tax=Vallitalea guaymasensis TaxID=1185412 RepID=UPI00187D4AA3|nr:hypothetical protein [Vallitalea guaymasensis]